MPRARGSESACELARESTGEQAWKIFAEAGASSRRVRAGAALRGDGTMDPERGRWKLPVSPQRGLAGFVES